MLERPPVYAPRSAVAASHPLAVEAALSILRLGGSAADAAVAAGSALTVLEPWASHVGGDAFAIAWDAAQGRARAIQGSGAAPAGTDPEAMRTAGAVPLRGALPITVPGVVGAWFRLLEIGGRLPVADVLAPAIRLARHGFPVGGRWERVARLQRSVIEADAGLAGLFSPAGGAARAGEWVRQPELATTLETLAAEGKDAFYGGSLGRRIVKEIRSRGGILAIEDLREHETEVIDPLALERSVPGLPGGVSVLEQPPVSQGAMVLAILRLLEEADRQGLSIEGDDPRAMAREAHLQIEAYRRVRADRDRWFGDPAFARGPVAEGLAAWLEGADAAAWISGIEAGLARPAGPRGESREGEGSKRRAAKKAKAKAGKKSEPRDTTYLCVADGEGNAVSWIQSIYHPFGAGWIVPGTGILLNNRMTGFSLDPQSPNCLEPRKRTLHTLNAWMALRDGKPWLLGGTPGAEAQIMVNVQVLRARLTRSIPLAEAIRAPRWQVDAEGRVCIEGRFPREVRRRLERRGHSVVRVGPWDGPGFYQAIERLDGGGWLACTDPRGEGLAAGM